MSKRRKKPTYPKRSGEFLVSSTMIKEDLPFPFVHYPGVYGTFMAFSKHEVDLPVLCECAKGAITNFFTLNEKLNARYSDKLKNAPLPTMVFPDVLSEESLSQNNPPFEWMRFEKQLCHRCNFLSPSVRWGPKGYGSKFKQYFGWYIQQTAYRLGVMPISLIYLEEVCPVEVVELFEELKKARETELAERFKLYELVGGPDRDDIAPTEPTFWHNVKFEEAEAYKDARKNLGRATRQVDYFFENITREEFGFRKVGEVFVSESLLFQIVQSLFPEENILRRYRPKWLDGLELDIYLPDQKLAIEYQGQQHFHPIKAWGGKKALMELQERDAKKLDICDQYGVKLITVDYTEPLIRSYIQERVYQEITQ